MYVVYIYSKIFLLRKQKQFFYKWKLNLATKKGIKMFKRYENYHSKWQSAENYMEKEMQWQIHIAIRNFDLEI